MTNELHTIHRQKKGFSLTEVALALGVVCIAMVSVVSLIGVAFDSSRASESNTMLVAMSSHVLQEMRAAPFDALWLADPRSTFRPEPPGNKAPVPSVYYFDSDGAPIRSDDNENRPGEAQYECLVEKTVDPLTRSANGGPFNRISLRLKFSWPVPGYPNSENRPNKESFNASIARY